MQDMILKLEDLVYKTSKTILEFGEDVVSYKISEIKWSKKEILGHLIDSAIHNLQRFTEVQFEPKPYIVRKYNQNDLVKVNRYQECTIENIVELWGTLNKQIIFVIKNLSTEELNYKIDIEKDDLKTLDWLIVDYVEHIQHHSK
ncbi:DinB family protein [Aquimarina algiphila]|uniref:DinB family protein n=1 Tax=Aquimarina algiphila TaxID=2047982 RepID=A0A554VM19_9FLAO|nr:DinB family protein [Aquimarina algiphila]TSE09258.1 DinB family protein [Aquimarina algiphila]